MFCDRVSSFRVNYIKSNNECIEAFLNANWLKFKKIVILKFDFYLVDKIYEFKLKWSEIFYLWKIYMQSVSSMIPVLCFSNFKNNDLVLDAFAAPWWKTTQMSAIMKNKWEIVACEKFWVRYEKLKFNIKNQWSINIKSIKTDINSINNEFNKETFDKILIDVPCSSEWKFNLNKNKTFWHWSEDLISNKSKAQKEYCSKIIPLLKKWWEIIYSTCSLAPEENEEIVDFIIKKYIDIEVSIVNIQDNEIFNKWLVLNWISSFRWITYSKEVKKTIRILPSVLTEWFFIAKFTRKL